MRHVTMDLFDDICFFVHISCRSTWLGKCNLLVKKEMDVDEHERLFNFTLGHKLK